VARGCQRFCVSTNRTSRAQNHWATPYTLFHTYIAERNETKGHITLESAHFKAYGCIAYAAFISYIKTPRANRLRKLDPRSDVGYLAGYDFTNIYRIWIPHTGRVIFIRNVIFNELKFFNGRKEYLTVLKLAQLDDLVQRIQLLNQIARNKAIIKDKSNDVFELLPDLDASEAIAEDLSLKVDEKLEKALNQELLEAYGIPNLENDERIKDYIEVAISYSFLHLSVRLKRRSAEGFSAGGVAEGLYYQGVSNAENAVKAESPAFITGGTAKANLARCWLAAFSAGQRFKVHRRELPDAPKGFKNLENHPLKFEFFGAMDKHLKNHAARRSWDAVRKKKAIGYQVLNCMWVFTYKTNKHEMLQICKTRLVVCGN
jgi:hypothetical protein